jgi:tetratricopeptide (TPR) repeat protein
VDIKPAYAEAHLNLGLCLAQKGKIEDAMAHYQKALGIKAGYAEAHNNLGICFAQQGKLAEAIPQFQKALEINPGYLDAHHNLGNSLLQQGQLSEAIVQYQKTLEIQPVDATVQNILAWLLATSPQASLRNGHRAVDLARQANALTGGKDPMILQTLSAALAETGQFDEAVRTVQAAIPLAKSEGQTALVSQLNAESKRYEVRLPWHQ